MILLTAAIYFQVMRMYLNYAEALNEAEPGHADILISVNAIRLRAGIPDQPSGLSQAGMRQRIRNGRRIALPFENHRFWDVRRRRSVTNGDGYMGLAGYKDDPSPKRFCYGDKKKLLVASC